MDFFDAGKQFGVLIDAVLVFRQHRDDFLFQVWDGTEIQVGGMDPEQSFDSVQRPASFFQGDDCVVERWCVGVVCDRIDVFSG